MKTIATLLSFILISSCSMFQKRVIDYSEVFVTGIGTERLSSDSIKSNLLRTMSMAGGNYQIAAFPMTTAYVNAITRELAEVKGLSKRNSLQLREKLQKKYLKSRVCLEVNITIKEFEQVKDLDSWRITLIDSNNIAYKLDWLPEPPSHFKIPVAITSTRNSYHGKEKMWSLSGQPCAMAEVEMKKGFKVIFKPSFVQWPFDDEFQEEWSFNYSKIVEGKKVEVKKKERKIEGYRGW